MTLEDRVPAEPQAVIAPLSRSAVVLPLADLSVIEAMPTRMFVGVPAGRHDSLLDFSTATTGGVSFVPSRDVLEALGG